MFAYYNGVLIVSKLNPEARGSFDMPPLPYPLLLWLQCEQHHCLLVEGGILDQPDLLWLFVTMAGRYHEEWLEETKGVVRNNATLSVPSNDSGLQAGTS